MPMDWNQDPILQRLEEKLDRVLELLERESKTNFASMLSKHKEIIFAWIIVEI